MEKNSVCEKFGHDSRTTINKVAIGIAKSKNSSETLKYFLENSSDSKELILLGFGYGQIMADGNEKKMIAMALLGRSLLRAAEEYT